jgi:hypothetical protein
MSDDLFHRIHQAQVRAGEDAVIADLESKGLIPKTPNKAAAAIRAKSEEVYGVVLRHHEEVARWFEEGAL